MVQTIIHKVCVFCLVNVIYKLLVKQLILAPYNYISSESMMCVCIFSLPINAFPIRKTQHARDPVNENGIKHKLFEIMPVWI
jgi:hypothetical protein